MHGVISLLDVMPYRPTIKIVPSGLFNSLSTECHLLIIFANSLDPDQDSVGPDLGPNCLTL